MTAPVAVAPKPSAPALLVPRVWRRDRTSIPTRPMLIGSAVVGVLAALILDVDTIGVAYAIVFVGVTVVVGLLTPPRLTPIQWGACAGALALFGVAAVRGAGWLVFVCLVAAWVVFTWALIGGRTWTGIALGTIMPWRAPLRVMRFARRRNARPGAALRVPAVRVVAVGAVSVAMLLIFGSLFASADPEFAKFFDGAAPSIRVDETIAHLLIGVLVAFGTLTAVYLRRRTPDVDALAPMPASPLPLWEWVVPLAMLNVLFLGFVAVQLKTLFGGDKHVQVTDGLTYADYARQGFWQLMMVTVLTLLVIAVAVRRVDRDDRRSRALARGLLGALCTFSLVIVASAVHRMWLYENQYGFTRLRVSVFAVELLLGLVFVLLIIAGVRMSGAWLPTAVLAMATVGLLGFAFFNPDAYIAEKNVERFEQGKSIDVNYLSTLSVDAVPALDRLPEPQRSDSLWYLKQELRGSEDSWWEFNSARKQAREILFG
ncbi:DUF4173 domain-containing protein [Rhodococcus sp. IEGM 1366]|uniref:Uncharacterized protein DUF4173 n=1 Tax=Nocardia globerula TaxID=1818 RepID=A0A652YTC0_NOCGL|nr:MULTISPECIES: DUF4173 domain-containing protein [Rhodococcus]MDV8068658.1 DUF4173 domain-containing protein [Rhodococcus sp. IEGM 1366]NMD61154.1 DUF4173 domain-containing protein [Nocardia globerula]PVX67291.1 uncharacterized protein DUF4173 [Rhodococcus globerulus]ROZ44014.1 DUF4173 domain-containing protein [Rhodococcus sp. WS3]